VDAGNSHPVFLLACIDTIILPGSRPVKRNFSQLENFSIPDFIYAEDKNFDDKNSCSYRSRHIR
jgi:hypothetical protein